MPKRQSRKSERDENQAAFAAKQRVIALTEGDASEPREQAAVLPMHPRKNPAAVALGRKGGLQRARNGGIDKIDPMRRREIASAAARVRWAKKYHADEG